MMEHIRQFDWCATSGPTDYFVKEAELDNSNIEKILRNKFRDPLLSSDEDDEPNVIDWGSVFKNNTRKFVPKQFCPGLRPPPQYPKLSVLTATQHYQCLKVLSAKYPHVYERHHMPKPSPLDRRCLEALTEIYESEQKEFIEWAKSQWESQHCSRALRPKPAIETVYEAEFKMRARRLEGYPQLFDMAAQIPIESNRGHMYEAVLVDTLNDVKLTDVPSIVLPELTKNFNIMNSDSVPEPCQKHPYPFILPNEHNVSILPIAEIHRELANFAAENNTKYIASENALRCLVGFNRHWTIPVTVCSAFTPDGESINVVVLDSEFSVHKEPAMTRIYRAYRHLLAHALIPPSEMETRIETYKKEREARRNSPAAGSKGVKVNEPEFTSEDDEPLGLFIFEANEDDSENTKSDENTGENKTYKEKNNKKYMEENSGESEDFGRSMSLDDINDIIGVYNCTCADTLFEVPPQRSFKKWRFTDRTNNETHNMIIHCSHKAKELSTELVLEPIPEYQLELGGSQLPPDRIRGLALSLMLRNKAAALNVRIDASNGDVVMWDKIPGEQFLAQQQQQYAQQILNVIHSTLSELEGLLPGHYVLQHEPSHGANAFLLVSRQNGERLELNFDSRQLMETDEAKMVKEPPIITPMLMPFHKCRKILPCAFTPFEAQVAKEPRKPPTKLKTPPQAIKWPKKRSKKKKKKTNN